MKNTWLGLCLALSACAANGLPSTEDAAPPSDAGTTAGFIDIQQKEHAASVTAVFRDATTIAELEAQEPSTVGACSVVATSSISYSGSLSAGTLTLDADDEIALKFADGDYAGGALSASFFGPAEAIAVAATGGDVPAFATSLTAPSAVTLSITDTTIDRNRDFVVSWTPVANAARDTMVRLMLSTTGGAVVCVADGASGSATFPTHDLQQLAGASATLYAQTFSQATLAAGATQVQIRADADVLNADGTRLAQTFTLE